MKALIFLDVMIAESFMGMHKNHGEKKSLQGGKALLQKNINTPPHQAALPSQY